MLSRKKPPLHRDYGIIIVSLLVIDIAPAIVRAIITILDRNQINRMKQFGDISDLISRI